MSIRVFGKSLIVLVALVVLGTHLFGQNPAPIVFQNVSVIPMDRERVLPNQAVLVQNGKIVSIGPAAGVKAPAGAVVVDGRGKFLIPGLQDMHTHIPPQFAFQMITDEQLERNLTLYVANGVTTVRSTHGQMRHLVTRERVAAGKILGPTLFITPTILSGNPRFAAENNLSVEETTRRVTEAKAAGYDFFKIHRLVPSDAFDAAMETAKKVGIRVGGHVPEGIAIARAFKANYWSIDHADGYAEALTRPGAPEIVFFGINLTEHIDESGIPALVKATKDAGTWVIPTETLIENWYTDEDPAQMAKRPEFKYVDASLAGDVEYWTARQIERLTAYPGPIGKKFFAFRRRLLKALHAGGVGLVLGSETPIDWTVPGFNTHRELKLMVTSGFTPYQALEMSTRNGGLFLGTPDVGTIEVGKRADLVLLNANPLQDISNTTKIDGVMLRGRWLLHSELQRAIDGGPVPKFCGTGTC